MKRLLRLLANVPLARWAVLAMFVCLAWLLLAAVGCDRERRDVPERVPPIVSPEAPAPTLPAPALPDTEPIPDARLEMYHTVRRVARPIVALSAVGAAGMFVASFIFPSFGRLRMAAAGALAAAVAGVIVQYMANRYGGWVAEAMFWGGVVPTILSLMVAAGASGYALMVKHMRRVSAELAEHPNHKREAVALEAVAMKLTPAERKAMLAELENRP